MAKQLGRLLPGINTRKPCLFVCDIQERFRTAIWKMDAVIHGAKILMTACSQFNIPIVITEQYPKGLGKTVSELQFTGAQIYEKTKFSMWTKEVEAIDIFKDRDTNTPIILCGLEAHVCVQQTALDLLALGFPVHVVADAVSSSRSYDRQIALDRLRNSGAFITTYESLLLELVGDAASPEFKFISGLIKEPRPSVFEP